MTNDKKRIAIITGASSGFGRLFAHELERNIDLEEIWLVARREEKLIETANSLERVKGIIIVADLSTQEGLDSVLKKAQSENPSVKVLINNAGFGRSEEFTKGDEEYYSRMIDLNVKAPVILTKRLLKYMDEGSKILNIASSAAFAPLPYFAVYAASKSFLLNFSYALNVELKSKDISVTCVCPGPAATEFFRTKQKKINGLKIEDPKKIVRKAIRDMKKKRKISICGFRMNTLRIIFKFIPRSYLAWAAGKIKFPK
ncbi:MAG: SDR family NAD(P)-dependent oxidoreductase [Candidatus Delongbacteria bacterium]|nr:SDR family NAD(P)-dependent oxidoreductase [Candidatus Delongbacteria bacterium]